MIPINVVIADDHPGYRNGMADRLGNWPDIKIVGQASSGRELLQVVDETKPDVVLTDIQMGREMSGIEAADYIHKKYPAIAIVALSAFYDPYMVMRMLQVGAIGYVVKTSEDEVIVDAIRKAFRNESYHCETSSRVLSVLIREKRFNPKTLEILELTAREATIIKLICDNYSNKQIAEKLKTTLAAIQSARRTIYKKTDTKGTPGLIEFAVRNGYYEWKGVEEG